MDLLVRNVIDQRVDLLHICAGPEIEAYRFKV